jgi:hypothetical protein
MVPNIVANNNDVLPKQKHFPLGAVIVYVILISVLIQLGALFIVIASTIVPSQEIRTNCHYINVTTVQQTCLNCQPFRTTIYVESAYEQIPIYKIEIDCSALKSCPMMKYNNYACYYSIKNKKWHNGSGSIAIKAGMTILYIIAGIVIMAVVIALINCINIVNNPADVEIDADTEEEMEWIQQIVPTKSDPEADDNSSDKNV